MISVEKNPNIDLLLVMGPSQITLAVLLLIRRRILGKNNSWKTCSCLLPKAISLFLLLRISG